MAPVSVVVIGAGDRGTGYARWALRHADRVSVVAVADPARYAASGSPPSTASQPGTWPWTGGSWPAAAGWPMRC